MAQLGASSSGVEQERVPGVGNGGERFSELIHTFKNDSPESERIDVDECCQLLQACKSNEDYFIAFAILPKMLKMKILNESECSNLIKVLPINLLRKMIIDQEDAKCSNYRDLAVDILSVILPNSSLDDAFKFESLIEPLHASIVSQRNWEVAKLENISSVLLQISNGMLDIDDIIELVDLIAENLYEHTDELPSKILLNIVGELLKKLVNETEYLNERDFPKRSSPTHLRVVIRRLIQTKHLPEEYRSLCFMLSALLVCLLDFHWFESDPQFVVLLAALTDVQIRMVLDNPKLIKIEELIECATLGESFIECVELGEFLDDERATILSRYCHEYVSYICEYLIECRKDETIELAKSIEVVLYRFICSFMAVGGYRIMDVDIIKQVLPTLIHIAQRSCDCDDDTSLTDMLLPSLPNFDALPDSCLALILAYLRSFCRASDRSNLMLSEIAYVVGELKDRSDWYKKSDLEAAREIVVKLNDRDLSAAFEKLK